MSETVTYQGNRTEDGLVRINEFGKVEVTLFPTGKHGYGTCNSEELKTIIRDMWRFFNGKAREGHIHGRRVRIEYTRRSRLRMVKLSVGFISLVLRETKKRSRKMALLSVETPFDATVGGETTNAFQDEQWRSSGQFNSEKRTNDEQWEGKTSKPSGERKYIRNSGEQW